MKTNMTAKLDISICNVAAYCKTQIFEGIWRAKLVFGLRGVDISAAVNRQIKHLHWIQPGFLYPQVEFCDRVFFFSSSDTLVAALQSGLFATAVTLWRWAV